MSFEEDDKATWELIKENAAPLQRGRNASTLGKTLTLSSKLSSKVKEDDTDIKTYESLVQKSELFANECLDLLQDRGEKILDQETVQELSRKYGLNDGDPLCSWLRYIKYHEEAYPSDTHSQFLLMERCTRAFLHFPRYADDPRYIRVCVLYADRTCNPHETFISFHQNKIGLKTSIFWLAWAWLSEKKEDFAFAEKIFRKAMSKKAQPSNVIEIRYKQFQRRMSRHFLNSAERIENEYNDANDNKDNGNRRVLGSISEEGVKYNQRSSTSITNRTVQSQSHQPVPANNNIGGKSHIPTVLDVYVDHKNEESPRQSNLDASQLGSGLGIITTEQDKCKENKISAERWNERGGLKATYNHREDYSDPLYSQSQSHRWTDSVSDSRSSGGGPFAVFVDEEFASKSSHETENSRQDYPSKSLDTGKGIRNDLERASSHRSKHQSGTCVIGQGNNIERSNVQINASEEQCFEEKRAAMKRYTLITASSNFNDLMQRPDDSNMDIDDGTGETTEAHLCQISRISISGNDPTLSNNSFQTYSTTNSSIVDSDAVGLVGDREETINTRLARGELSMMFSSPGVGDKSISDKTPNLFRAKSASRNFFSSSISSHDLDKSHKVNVNHLPSDTSIHIPSTRSKKIKFDSNVVREDGITYEEMFDKNRKVSHFIHSPMTEVVDSKNDHSKFKIFKEDKVDARIDGATADLADIERVIVAMKVDDDGERATQRNRGSRFMSKPDCMDVFGDISLIAPTDDTCDHGITLGRKLLSYDDLHSANTNEALLRVKDDCMKQKLNYHYSSKCIPQSLTKSSVRNGCQIELGNVSCTIRYELGRGCNGTVVLCSFSSFIDGAGDRDAALKIQRPTNCLAWEYQILRTIDSRLSTNMSGRENPSSHPFPRPISFSIFSDGGICTMTAASGINLLDVVNAHKSTVPELIAIYYTARMLAHLETLHLQCDVLHCDIKPDNWVLTTAPLSILEKPCPAILGGDIMLVDFGRSIDMASIREPPLSIFFTGSICAEDMECIAMREGKPWAADVDTFGLCASAHVLLFGCHMEVEYDNTRCRWQLKKRFRRYWQQELWCKMFESLLNLAPGECHSIKLGEIRKDFETYLNGVRNDVMTFLKGQIGYFSKK